MISKVNLAIEPGEVAFIGGSNGAGKTTLMRVAAGLLTPDSGEVSSLGLHPGSERRAYQRQLGWLPAGNGGLYNRLTVRQNLEYWAALALLGRSRRKGAVGVAMDRFDLGRLAANRADRISMGERQRLRLAMTFLHRPLLVLLDEPETSLDVGGVSMLRDALLDLVARGGGAAWCAPSREGATLPADSEYRVAEAKLTRC